VRTTLAVLVSEMLANVPEGTVTPSAEVATHALHVAVTGKRNKLNVVAPQGGSTVTTAAPEEPRRWLRIAAAVVIGLITIAGVIFALMQAQGWSFG
jgi:hypothetical protein